MNVRFDNYTPKNNFSQEYYKIFNKDFHDSSVRTRLWRIFAGEKGFLLGYHPNLFFKKILDYIA